MSFTGTQQKCKNCDKTVHLVDSVSTDGIIFHKNCFKCSVCNGLLVMSNYCSMDGLLYCKTHYEQLFKETGSYPKPTGAQANDKQKSPGKYASFFSGTQDKCSVCKKTVYPLEKVSVEGEMYHKPCFRCAQGGCQLTTSDFAALNGVLYCKPHFAQLFKERGSYNISAKSPSTKTIEMEEGSSDDKADTETKTEPESAET